MKITIRNDKKEKHDSFEAKYDDFIGYWSTELEAVDDLQYNINKKLQILQNIDYRNIYHAKAWNDISND